MLEEEGGRGESYDVVFLFTRPYPFLSLSFTLTLTFKLDLFFQRLFSKVRRTENPVFSYVCFASHKQNIVCVGVQQRTALFFFFYNLRWVVVLVGGYKGQGCVTHKLHECECVYDNGRSLTRFWNPSISWKREIPPLYSQPSAYNPTP